MVRPVKAHLALCRVHIAIKREGIHRDPQDRQRMPPLRQGFGIRFAEGLKDRRTLDDATIQNHKLQFAVRPPLPRFGNEAFDANTIFLERRNRHEARDKIRSKKIANPHLVIMR